MWARRQRKLSRFTTEIMGAAAPRTVPGTVCGLLDKQLFSLRPQARGQVPRMGTKLGPH